VTFVPVVEPKGQRGGFPFGFVFVGKGVVASRLSPFSSLRCRAGVVRSQPDAELGGRGVQDLFGHPEAEDLLEETWAGLARRSSALSGMWSSRGGAIPACGRGTGAGSACQQPPVCPALILSFHVLPGRVPNLNRLPPARRLTAADPLYLAAVPADLRLHLGPVVLALTRKLNRSEPGARVVAEAGPIGGPPRPST